MSRDPQFFCEITEVNDGIVNSYLINSEKLTDDDIVNNLMEIKPFIDILGIDTVGSVVQQYASDSNHSGIVPYLKSASSPNTGTTKSEKKVESPTTFIKAETGPSERVKKEDTGKGKKKEDTGKEKKKKKSFFQRLFGKKSSRSGSKSEKSKKDDNEERGKGQGHHKGENIDGAAGHKNKSKDEQKVPKNGDTTAEPAAIQEEPALQIEDQNKPEESAPQPTESYVSRAQIDAILAERVRKAEEEMDQKYNFAKEDSMAVK